jgi:hypothetical protein
MYFFGPPDVWTAFFSTRKLAGRCQDDALHGCWNRECDLNDEIR